MEYTRATPSVPPLYNDMDMELFSRVKKPIYAALIDIGSGSVLISIIVSDGNNASPTIIWSHREIAPLKQTAVEIPAKHLMSTLLNAVMLIDSKGIETVRDHDPQAKLTHVQISYSAPWSYTVHKIMSFTETTSFTVTKELLNDIISTITKKIDEERVDKELMDHHGLTIIDQTLSGLTINGYQSHDPIGQTATNVSLSHTSDIADTIMVDAITELQKKVLPRATTTQHSFMHMFHHVMQTYETPFNDSCLVNITYEATEIGVVRNHILEYTTTVPVGINTLVRGYSKALNVPHEEAYSFLREPYHSRALETMSAEKRKAVDAVTDEYKRNLATLFSENTTLLSIPKAIVIHNPQDIDEFLHIAIAEAAKEVTCTSHTIRNVNYYSPAPLKSGADNPSLKQVTISAQFFHHQFNHIRPISL